ncbi:MAG: AAA family ATPase [Xenococcaceae cyanobacterium]
MNDNPQYVFYGDPKYRPENPHRDSPQQPEPYIADPELIDAVNLAIFLRRPLLIEGEAGCGKTRLAIAVAYELGLPFYRWDIRSTTKAQEGLYEYDAILRLHDVQTQKVSRENQAESSPTQKVEEENKRDPKNPKDYRTFGAIGQAFQSKDCPAVVLIDEIDKADIDFPNDLLAVLDEPWSFTIRETGETIRAQKDCQPIVIITSNKEKGNLPAPFLRRCLYYYIKFPSAPDKLQEIVDIHYQIKQASLTNKREQGTGNREQGTGNKVTPPNNKLVQTAAKRFLKIREDKGLFKIPGTSEFLDWLYALHCFRKTPYPVSELVEEKPIPYRELVFKIRQDWQNLKYAPKSGNREQGTGNS